MFSCGRKDWDLRGIALIKPPVSFVSKHPLKAAPPDVIALSIVKFPHMALGRGVNKHSVHSDLILPQMERGLLTRSRV